MNDNYKSKTSEHVSDPPQRPEVGDKNRLERRIENAGITPDDVGRF